MAAFRLEVVRGLISEQRAGAPALTAKRAFDIVAGSMFLLLALPLMAILALAIRIDSPGPILYRPKRVGKGGHIFSMYKFRTMVDGADAKLDEVRHLNVANGMVKIPNDPRVTRVGSWLRRFSLDELPQLFNVIGGSMSLVGPRPHDVHELSGYDLEHDTRLTMPPGLTGLWQISARNDPRFDRRFELDVQYVTAWSLLADAKILASTLPAVLRGKGGTVTAAPISAGGGGGELEPQFLMANGIQPIGEWPVAEPRE